MIENNKREMRRTSDKTTLNVMCYGGSNFIRLSFQQIEFYSDIIEKCEK